MTQRIPMRRTGKREVIAALVHFRTSPDATKITGEVYDAPAAARRIELFRYAI